MMKQHSNTSGVALITVALIFIFLLLPAALQAGEVTLAWDPNSEGNLAGYKLYYDSDSDIEMYQGTGANEGDSPVIIYVEDLDDADTPTFTLTGLTSGEYYYFALTAFDTDGLESDFSDEVGTLIAAASTLGKSVSNGDTGGSGGSGCFIAGSMDGAPTILPLVAFGFLLFLSAAMAVLHSGLNTKRALHRKRI